MSIHKLSAGSGYDYLTRQVAALDTTAKGHAGLASYYAERGESPGTWIGSGMAGIDGLSAGDRVTAEQMKALFGAGMHPLSQERLEQLDAADLTDANVRAATQLGVPFKIYAGDVSPFRVEEGNGSPRSRRRANSWAMARSLKPIGRGSVPRWRGSSSETSMAAIRSMRARSLPSSLRGHVRGRRRLPVMT